MNPSGSNWLLETEFYPDAVMRFRDLLHDTFGDTFRAYYDGSPDPVGASMCPCIAVTERQMDFDTGATETDQNTHNLIIRVIFNKRDDYGAVLADKNVNPTERKLRMVVAGRDKTTGNYLPNTILGVLRPNFTLGSFVIGNRGRVTWGIPDAKQAEGVETAEARIELTVTELQVIPVRS